MAGPTVIDALIITLGLDPTNFQKGQKQTAEALLKTREDAERTAKELEEQGKKGAMFFKGLRNEALSFTSALLAAGGVKEFVLKTYTANAELGRMAKSLDMNAGELSVLQNAFVRAGGTAEGAGSSIKNITQEMQRLQLTGKSGLIPFLYQARVDVGKFTDLATPAREQILLLADAFSQLDPKRAQFIGASMGLDDRTILTLQKGRTAMSAFINEAQRLAHVTGEDADAAIRLQTTWDSLANSARNLGSAVVSAMTPIDQAVASAGKSVLDWAASGSLGSTIYDAVHGSALPGEKSGRGTGGPSWFSTQSARSRSPGASAAKPAPVAGGKSAGFVPRNIRNNNPGNLNFARQDGASLESGPDARFAKFGTMAEGVAALQHQLMLYKSRGIDTLEDIISIYAPKKDKNDTAGYIAFLAKKLGVGAKDHLDFGNQNVLRGLISNISRMEGDGGRLTVDQINAGMSLYASRQGGGGKTEVKIDHITVQTQAIDAKGIARDLGPAIQQYSFATQANTGLD